MRRGQVAIEFLTTYSYALFLLALVGSGIYLLDLGNPDRYTQRACVLDSQIECLEAQYELNEGGTDVLNLRLRNNYPKEIVVSQLNISLDGSRVSDNNALNGTNGIRISSGEDEIISVDMDEVLDGSGDWSDAGYVSTTVMTRTGIAIEFEPTSSGNSYSKSGYLIFRAFET